MFKVAVVTNSLYELDGLGKKAGGGHVVTAELIRQLNKMPNIELCVFAYENKLTSAPDYKTVIINNFDIYEYLKQVDEYINNENFDIVITSNIEQLYKNNLLQAHSYIGRCKNAGFITSFIKQILSRRKIKYEKNIFKKLTDNSKFIAMSETIKKDYSANLKIKPENIKVVYPGCSQVYETYKTPERKEIPTFGIVANSSLNKGGHLFLFAAGILKLFNNKFNIKIIAPKYNKDILMKSIVYLFGLKNNIEVLDKQDDMSQFYKSIDFLVLPSFNEAFGLVVIEAGAFCKPAVISSAAGSSEIINNENGLVFNIKSLISFIKTLNKACKMYTDDYELYLKYTKEAYELSKKFSWEGFAKKIIEELS